MGESSADAFTCFAEWTFWLDHLHCFQCYRLTNIGVIVSSSFVHYHIYCLLMACNSPRNGLGTLMFLSLSMIKLGTELIYHILRS